MVLNSQYKFNSCEQDSISSKRNSVCGGAVVYWIEPLTLNQRVAGSNPDRELRTFVLQQVNSSTLLLSTQE